MGLSKNWWNFAGWELIGAAGGKLAGSSLRVICRPDDRKWLEKKVVSHYFLVTMTEIGPPAPFNQPLPIKSLIFTFPSATLLS